MAANPDNRRRADLERLLEISRAMAATVDLDALLGLIVDRAVELAGSERATVFLYDGGAGELVSRIASGVKEIRFPADRGVAGAVVRSGETIIVPDAYADQRFNPEIDRRTGFRTRNMLAVPLRDHEAALVGVLQVLNKRDGAFDQRDRSLAETLAAQAGVVLQRDRLIDHYLAKQRMERAMEIARQVQQDLLPAGPPDIPGYDVAGFSRPADETGGDIYDFLPGADGTWTFLVADASGHGIGPALVIAETRAMLRVCAMHGAELPCMVQRANDLLSRDLDTCRFVTCFVGRLDPAAGTFSYVSAGHGPILFHDAAAGRTEQAAATGLPLGVMEGADFSQVVRRQLAPGDFAAIITDGIFEAAAPDGAAFGIGRMTDRLAADAPRSAAEMLDNLRRAVADHTAGTAQADDLTAVVLRRVRP
jgi:phosphoserine phosphatase